MAQVVKRFNVAAGRPYKSRDGEDKKQWVNAGRAVQWDDGGISIELTAVPVGNWWDGRLSLFEQQEGQRNDGGRQQQGGNSGYGNNQGGYQRQPSRQTSPVDEFDDSSIPF